MFNYIMYSIKANGQHLTDILHCVIMSVLFLLLRTFTSYHLFILLLVITFLVRQIDN